MDGFGSDIGPVDPFELQPEATRAILARCSAANDALIAEARGELEPGFTKDDAGGKLPAMPFLSVRRSHLVGGRTERPFPIESARDAMPIEAAFRRDIDGGRPELPDLELLRCMEAIHNRRGRGLSPTDLATIAELNARCLTGYWFEAGKSEEYGHALPSGLRDLLFDGERCTRAREFVAFLVFEHTRRGSLGTQISFAKMAAVSGVGESTLKESVRWCEERSILVRSHTFRNTTSAERAEGRGPVKHGSNVYFAGPELLEAIERGAGGSKVAKLRSRRYTATLRRNREAKGRYELRQAAERGEPPPQAWLDTLDRPGMALVSPREFAESEVTAHRERETVRAELVAVEDARVEDLDAAVAMAKGGEIAASFQAAGDAAEANSSRVAEVFAHAMPSSEMLEQPEPDGVREVGLIVAAADRGDLEAAEALDRLDAQATAQAAERVATVVAMEELGKEAPETAGGVRALLQGLTGGEFSPATIGSNTILKAFGTPTGYIKSIKMMSSSPSTEPERPTPRVPSASGDPAEPTGVRSSLDSSSPQEPSSTSRLGSVAPEESIRPSNVRDDAQSSIARMLDEAAKRGSTFAQRLRGSIFGA